MATCSDQGLQAVEERAETLLTCWVIAVGRHLGRVHGRAHRKPLGLIPQLGARYGLVAKPVPALIRSSLVEASKGARDVDVPIDLSWASEYFQEVLAAAMRIPRGQTRPYSWLAREARRPLAVCAAASAMAKNPLWLLVPCHRVIAADGTIGSYGPSGVEKKRELLKREGVTLPNRKSRADKPRRG